MSDTYSSRKALKLATALYMVTDIMSEKEPLKWHLRNCAVALLESDAASILRGIEQTLDILSIARIARAVSPMNADVLEDELRALEVLLAARGSAAPTPAPLFTSDFFDVLEIAAPTRGGEEQADASLATIAATTEAVAVKAETAEAKPVAPPIEKKIPVSTPLSAPRLQMSDIPKPIAPLPIKEKEVIKAKPITMVPEGGIRSAVAPHITLVDADVQERQARSEETRNSRREIITGVIATKQNCSIKDISAKLQNVSEKTIQRELSAMVEEGILIKEGDRRWSTYRIARLPLLH